MFDINKNSLLDLNNAMQKTILDMNYDNPMELSAFASTMVSIGNQMNIQIIKKISDEKYKSDK